MSFDERLKKDTQGIYNNMTEAVRFRLNVPFSHKEASGGDEEVLGDEINRGPVAIAEKRRQHHRNSTMSLGGDRNPPGLQNPRAQG
jgi:hypothetical protein